MKLKSGIYAPVHKAEINHDLIAYDIIHGFAAPLRGPNPCRVELISEGQIISVADACGFSDIAWAAGLRFGWCSFRLGGLSTASALGSEVYLRCSVSGNLIEQFDPETLTFSSDKKPELSVLELRKFIGDLFGCVELDHIVPFADRYRKKYGDYAFIEASYTYLHNRKPGYVEVNEFLENLPKYWSITDCWQIVTESAEYASRRNKALPGIFSVDFPFGLELLD